MNTRFFNLGPQNQPGQLGKVGITVAPKNTDTFGVYPAPAGATASTPYKIGSTLYIIDVNAADKDVIARSSLPPHYPVVKSVATATPVPPAPPVATSPTSPATPVTPQPAPTQPPATTITLPDYAAAINNAIEFAVGSLDVRLMPPTPFASEASASAWYSAWFAARTGCRVPASQLTKVKGFTCNPGQTYSKLYITGTVKIAAGAKLVDCIVDGDTYAVSGTAADFVAEHCTFISVSSSMTQCGGTAGHPVIFRYCAETGSNGDGNKPGSYSRFFCCSFDHGGESVGSHADDFQPTPNATDIEVHTCYSNMPVNLAGTNTNTSFMLQAGVNNVRGFYLVLIGGNYNIHGDAPGFVLAFVWYFPNSARFGLSTAMHADAKVSSLFNAVTGAAIAITAK